jgi:hypothetical protein
MPRVRIAAVSCLAWFALGCSSSSPAESGQATKPPQRSTGAEQVESAPAASTPAPDLAYHMRASFWAAVQARDALIVGDLARAQSAADDLAKYDYAGLLPADWKHWTGQLQQYAKELSMAPNLAAAAQELGRMALVCGECHDLHQRGPTRPAIKALPWEDPPEAFDARMHRHQLGIAQMWDGLVLPSEDAWRAGTVTITRAPLRAPELAEEPIDEATNKRIEEVRALAKQARTAGTYEDRGRIYGELIARCAQCHAFARPARQPER